MKFQRGFSLIELVVVVVLLGVLSVTAAPRFLNVQDDARASTFHSLKGSFSTAVTLFNSKWLIDGEPNPNTIEDRNGLWGYKIYNLHYNKYGYPRIIADIQECETILVNLLPDSSLNRDDYTVNKTGEYQGDNKTGNVCSYEFISAPFNLSYHEISGKVELTKRKKAN
ncbi:prepilin-type N-terminal cleavage/methylation domain-containing protein [uncultured Photobacterium sp.]|uniref:prepilin-type N-terminal cleavage/methylation domain-containing protein n=1 Tax=uncultured Photobacterium sp. TaxID=173973 RepID=UPI00262ED12B|nr:prepilin-type N-terminal cleavage/methylation domain-containing protein [uncultured Photobacterium sp.]